MLRNQSAKIGAPSARRVSARQLAVHIGADLVAFAADRGTEVETQLRDCVTAVRERFDPPLHDSRRSASPSRMEQRDRARRMGYEDGHTISDADRESEPPFRRNVSVGVIDAQPSVPIAGMSNDARPVYLIRRSEAGAAGKQLFPHLAPTLHHGASRFLGGKTERSGRTRRRESANAERREVVDDF